MKRSLILCLLFCSGCSEMQSLQQPETKAWLALHAVDTLQTFDIAHDSHCYQERDGITRSLIGAHPSDGEVAAWSLASAGLHLGVTELLLRHEHPMLAKAWQYLRIGITADAVASNYRFGIRIGSPNQHRAGSCLQEVPSLPPPTDRPRPIG